ncbi:hypothetical protein FACS1894200_02350 [Spirochaetia bacterium]|nr:hypothetical protein FACS1894200_02350 [Spirochaetia bacterium]
MDILGIPESERFPLSRDLLYVSLVLLGFGAACLLHSFRASFKRNVRSRFITLFFIDIAAALAVFTAACVFSQLQLFSGEYRRVYSVGGGLLVLALLAVRFPKYVAFPLIIAGGILCIWVGYSFLQFPLLNDKEGLLLTLSRVDLAADSSTIEDTLVINFLQQNRITTLPPCSGLQGIEIEFRFITMGTIIPLIGGEKRGRISRILRNEEAVFIDTAIENAALNAWYGVLEVFAPVSFQKVTVQEYVANLKPAMNLSVYFDGTELSARTGW